MPLGAPSIAGVVSECSSWIGVEGQVVGNRVWVYRTNSANNTDVVVDSPAAVSPQQYFPLLQRKLVAGDLLVATQDDGNGESPRSPHPAVVQAKPPQLPSVVFTSPIYQCCHPVGVARAHRGWPRLRMGRG
jgi:hypothetical protein